MLALFFDSSLAININLKNVEGRNAFVISSIDSNFSINTEKNFVKIRIQGKKTPKEFYKTLKNKYFEFISLYNSDNNVNIVISAKSHYKILAKHNNNQIIILPQITTINKKNKIVNNYMNPNLFSKPLFDIGLITTKPTSQNFFYKGLAAYSSKNYNIAISNFSKLANDQNSPFFLNSLYLLASSYENINQYDKAIKTYNEILKYSLAIDAPGEILYKIAQIYKKQGDGRYIEILKKIVENYPYSKIADEAKFELGNEYYNAKKFNDAVLYYSSITKDSPYYNVGMLMAGYIFYLEQNYAQAAYLFYLVDLGEINSKKYAKELAAVGYTFCKMKDFKNADATFLLIKNSSTPDFYISKSECEFLQNKLKLASNTIGEGVDAFPKSKSLAIQAVKIGLFSNKLDIQKLENLKNEYKDNAEIMPIILYFLSKRYYEHKYYEKVIGLYLFYLKYKSSFNNDEYDFKDLAKESLDKFASIAALNLDHKAMLDTLKMAKALNLNLDSCDLAKAFMFSDQYKQAFASLSQDSQCRAILNANYAIKKGDFKKASADIESIKDKYYLSMLFGNMSYMNMDYNKSKLFFQKCLGSKDQLLKQYAQLKLAQIAIEQNTLSSPINTQNFKGIFLENAHFVNGLYYFNKKDCNKSLKSFQKVEGLLKYNERALFYETLCLVNLGQKNLARSKLMILEKNYPDSTLIKKLKFLVQ